MDLSNFYKDFSFKYEHFEALFQIYSDLMLAATDYVEQVKRNTVIPDIETYRIFPFQRIQVDNATYVLEEVLDNTKVVSKLGLQYIPLHQRVINWNTGVITRDQKIDALNLLNLYVPLTALRGYTNEPTYAVIDFTLFDGETKLNRNFDFVLKTNKMFLLGGVATKTQGKYLAMTNIAIDLNEPEDLIGKFVDIPYDDALTKNEYTEIVKMLIVSALGGPTIENLKRAIKSIAGFDQADLYDKYVSDPIKQKRWLKVNYTEFDFVVVFPEEYAAHMEKLQIIIDYLKMVKPAYSKFFIILQSLYSDLYNILLKANDAYNLDIIHELEEDESFAFRDDGTFADFVTETNEEVYTLLAQLPTALYYLNSPGMLNVNCFTFGTSPFTESDTYQDKVTENEDEIYDGADDEDTVAIIDSADEVYDGVLEEEAGRLVETPLEESYNNSEDSFAQTTVTITTPHYRLNGPQRLNVDLMTDRITDTVVYNY